MADMPKDEFAVTVVPLPGATVHPEAERFYVETAQQILAEIASLRPIERAEFDEAIRRCQWLQSDLAQQRRPGQPGDEPDE